MGKDKAFNFRDNENFVTKVISRSRFRRAIEAGINNVHPDNRGEIYVDELRRIAETAVTMDASTWRCKGSCGCPMTNAGVVLPTDDAGVAGTPGSPAQMFAASYDRAIGGSNAVKLTIVSDEEYAARQGASA